MADETLCKCGKRTQAECNDLPNIYCGYNPPSIYARHEAVVAENKRLSTALAAAERQRDEARERLAHWNLVSGIKAENARAEAAEAREKALMEVLGYAKAAIDDMTAKGDGHDANLWVEASMKIDAALTPEQSHG